MKSFAFKAVALAAGAGLLFFLATCPPTSAQMVESVVHSFGDGTVPTDGESPGDLILGNGGALYGTTAKGGQYGGGTVFKLADGKVSILHSFGANPRDGSDPGDLAQGSDGTLYGVSGGGAAKQGTFFKMKPAAQDNNATTYLYFTLHSFGDHSVSNDGLSPGCIVFGGDGNLYGVTALGGVANQGIVYKMTPNGTETILHAFSDGTVAGDGTAPMWITKGSATALYGVASGGGQGGSIFKIAMRPTAAGGMGYSYSVFHEFHFNPATNDGIFSTFVTVGTDGNLYGTKQFTGIDPPNMLQGGVLYRLTTDGVETLLHKFGDGTVANDGSRPGCVVQGADGRLYGETIDGGTAGQGTVYMYYDGTETVLHSFADGSVANDGQSPVKVVLLGNDLYGITESGGSAGQGTIFKLSAH